MIAERGAAQGGESATTSGRAPGSRWAVVVLVALSVVLIALLVMLARLVRPAPVAETPLPGTKVSARVIEGPGTGAHPRFDRPLGVAWAPDGSILVADTENGRVCVFEDTGKFLFEFGAAASGATTQAAASAGLARPSAVAAAPGGLVYVADIQRARVLVFDMSGTPVGSFAPSGRPTWSPLDLDVTDDAVYVADQSGISVFRLDGSFVGEIRPAVDGEPITKVSGIAVDGERGRLYVADSAARRLLVVELTGTQEGAPGRNLSGDALALPRGMDVTRSGSVVVADAFGFEVVSITADGEVSWRVGGRGTEPGLFRYPNDVAVRGSSVLVADKENDRVQVLRPGQAK